MVVKKRRKSSRLHGSGTYGWGKNKHRNSGGRGGYGNAGSGKKSHGKKPSVWGTDYFGKDGFVRQGQSNKFVTINVKDVQDRLQTWTASKNVHTEGGVAVVDLKKLGFTKLLSSGKVTAKMHIVINHATANAVKKVQAAGGKVVVDAIDADAKPVPAAKKQ